ncbi:hypothetical protein RBB75_20715 (plasmid) [Tunturibacter empetritectus]|uniref:Uncharacterized protein n=1 Tax=Tunturiibacter empetritectus TaxID=3069691 RepID=A0AAU7ZIJ5_9BACT
MIRTDHDDRKIHVTAFSFSLKEFSTTATAPFEVGYNATAIVPLSFTPHSAGHFDGTLTMSVSHGPDLVVSLSGDATCDLGSCEPKGPTCRINKSNEKWQQLDVPDFFGVVAPAIREQGTLHERGAEYDLPTTFMLKITGLKDVVTVKPPGSCDDNIHFTRIPHSHLRDRFIRTAHTESIAEGTVDGWFIHLEMPADMAGITVVGGGFSEFHFDLGKEPKLVLNYKGEPIFDGKVRCINSTFSGATLCQVDTGPARPKLNLEVK